MVDGHVLEGVARHARVQGVRRVLDDRHTAARLDRHQPGRAVVQGARHHHAHHPGGVRTGGAAEQRVDGGPVAVLVRAAGQVRVTGPEQHMMVGRRDVDAAVLDRLAVLDVAGWQRAAPAQDVGHGTGPGRRHMEDHEHGRRQLGRQGRGQADERFDAAGRGADDHDVVVRHGWSS
jgi:hypothetical protein